MSLEQFLSNYPSTIAAFTAIGTVGAVITSLCLAYISTKRFAIKRIQVYRRINQDKSEENYLGITIENLARVISMK